MKGIDAMNPITFELVFPWNYGLLLLGLCAFFLTLYFVERDELLYREQLGKKSSCVLRGFCLLASTASGILGLLVTGSLLREYPLPLVSCLIAGTMLFVAGVTNLIWGEWLRFIR